MFVDVEVHAEFFFRKHDVFRVGICSAGVANFTLLMKCLDRERYVDKGLTDRPTHRPQTHTARRHVGNYFHTAVSLLGRPGGHRADAKIMGAQFKLQLPQVFPLCPSARLLLLFQSRPIMDDEYRAFL